MAVPLSFGSHEGFTRCSVNATNPQRKARGPGGDLFRRCSDRSAEGGRRPG